MCIQKIFKKKINNIIQYCYYKMLLLNEREKNDRYGFNYYKYSFNIIISYYYYYY